MNPSFINASDTWTLITIMILIAALSIWMEQHFRLAAKISGCIMALVGAMALSNLGIIPTEAPAYDFVWDYIVPISIPMLLLEADLRKIYRDCGRLLVLYIISGVGTIAGGILAFALLKPYIPVPHAMTGMMIGTYTGGSMNLVAISDAFRVPAEVVSSAIVADNLLMVLYFLVLTFVSALPFVQKLFGTKKQGHVLKAGDDRRPNKAGFSASAGTDGAPAHTFTVLDAGKAFATAALIVALSKLISGGLGQIQTGSAFADTLIHSFLGNTYMLMTALSVILATFAPGYCSSINGAREIGSFFMHIFFAVIGVPASVYLILNHAPVLLLFCMIIVLVNMLVTFVFGRIFGFTIDEVCIASNANIGGPTTAAAMAAAKKWEYLVVPALLSGTLGYVLGNFYGLFAGNILQ